MRAGGVVHYHYGPVNLSPGAPALAPALAPPAHVVTGGVWSPSFIIRRPTALLPPLGLSPHCPLPPLPVLALPGVIDLLLEHLLGHAVTLAVSVPASQLGGAGERGGGLRQGHLQGRRGHQDIS